MHLFKCSSLIKFRIFLSCFMMICKIIRVNIIRDTNIIRIIILDLYNDNSNNNYSIFFSIDYLYSTLYNGRIREFDIE